MRRRVEEVRGRGLGPGSDGPAGPWTFGVAGYVNGLHGLQGRLEIRPGSITFTPLGWAGYSWPRRGLDLPGIVLPAFVTHTRPAVELTDSRLLTRIYGAGLRLHGHRDAAVAFVGRGIRPTVREALSQCGFTVVERTTWLSAGSSIPEWSVAPPE